MNSRSSRHRFVGSSSARSPATFSTNLPPPAPKSPDPFGSRPPLRGVGGPRPGGAATSPCLRDHLGQRSHTRPRAIGPSSRPRCSLSRAPTSSPKPDSPFPAPDRATPLYEPGARPGPRRTIPRDLAGARAQGGPHPSRGRGLRRGAWAEGVPVLRPGDRPGGLPLGVAGRVVALVDGTRGALGAWLMMKRGCRCAFISTEGGRAHVEEVLRRFDPKSAPAPGRTGGDEQFPAPYRRVLGRRRFGPTALGRRLFRGPRGPGRTASSSPRPSGSPTRRSRVAGSASSNSPHLRRERIATPPRPPRRARPASGPFDRPAALSSSAPDTAINERRARWLEERLRFEQARARTRAHRDILEGGDGLSRSATQKVLSKPPSVRRPPVLGDSMAQWTVNGPFYARRATGDRSRSTATRRLAPGPGVGALGDRRVPRRSVDR